MSGQLSPVCETVKLEQMCSGFRSYVLAPKIGERIKYRKLEKLGQSTDISSARLRHLAISSKVSNHNVLDIR